MRLQAQAARLQRIHAALDDNHQNTLLEFAEFILQRSGAELPTHELPLPDGILPEPAFEEPPEDETVSGALARLSRVYEMLDVEALQAQASLGILEGAAMREKTPRQLIDELERFFAERYQRARLIS
ncbi:MAG: Crp/Fnr family transcriptional regulator [Granulosicoccaceae bacterium]